MRLATDGRTCAFCFNSKVDPLDTSLNVFWTIKSCLHEICGRCKVEKLVGSNTPCNACGKKVLRNSLTSKSREQLEFELEREIRASIAKEFNKELNDFGGDERAFNDYLELVETLVHVKLTNDQSRMAWADEEIQKNRKKNATVIAENEALRVQREQISQLKKAERDNKKFMALRDKELQKRNKKLLKEKIKQEESEVALGERQKVTVDITTGVKNDNSRAQKSGLLRHGRNVLVLSAKHLDIDGNEQPRPKTTSKDELARVQAKLVEQYSKGELTKKRREAGGYTSNRVKARILESMEDGLQMLLDIGKES